MFTRNQLVNMMQQWSYEHRQMAEVLTWLSSELPRIAAGPFPIENMYRPLGWSYRATQYRFSIVIALTAPSPELAKMLTPLDRIPTSTPYNENQIVFVVGRPRHED